MLDTKLTFWILPCMCASPCVSAGNWESVPLCVPETIVSPCMICLPSPDPEGDVSHNSWCHGATGIVLSRMDSIAARTQLSGASGGAQHSLQQVTVKYGSAIQQIRRMASAQQQRESGNNDTYCCGVTGIIDTLAQIDCVLSPHLSGGAMAATAQLQRFAAGGLGFNITNFSLYQGTGGVIYSMLQALSKLKMVRLVSVGLWKIPIV
jgi:hypothetical protein